MASNGIEVVADPEVSAMIIFFGTRQVVRDDTRPGGGCSNARAAYNTRC
ncbi:MAG: hypothetical protein U0074_12315 [Kouleothrix sp.]